MKVKGNAIKVFAMVIVLLFLSSGLLVMVNVPMLSGHKNSVQTNGMENNFNSVPNLIKGASANILNTEQANKANSYLIKTLVTSADSANSSSNYTEQTLVLSNNTLINGNFVSTANGLYPFWLAYDSVDNTIYVANYGSNTVSVISGSTDKVTGTVDVGSRPGGVAYDSASNAIYVANPGSNNVSVISGSTSKVTGTVDVGSYPIGVAYDSADNTIYVANVNSNNVSVISGSTSKVTGTVDVGSRPEGVAYDSTDNTIYVANYGSGSITIILFPRSSSPSGISYIDLYSIGGIVAAAAIIGSAFAIMRKRR